MDSNSFESDSRHQLIEQYYYNDNFQTTVTELKLYNDDEAAQVKIDPYYIQLEPYIEGEQISLPTNGDPKTEYPLLWENTEISTILDPDSTFKGVVDKASALGNEISILEKQISDLESSFTSQKESYISTYNNLIDAIVEYNQQVYTFWAASAIYEIFNNANNANTNADFNKIKTNIEYTLLSSYVDAEQAISDTEQSFQKYYTACDNLYTKLYSLLPSIETYNKMIEDTNNNQILDDYLEEQIKIKRAQVVICLFAFIDGYSALKEVFNNFSNDEKTTHIEDFDTIEQYCNNILSNTCQKNYGNYQISDTILPNNDILIDYIKKLQYEKLQATSILLSNPDNYQNLQQIALISSNYDDIEYLGINLKNDRNFDYLTSLKGISLTTRNNYIYYINNEDKLSINDFTATNPLADNAVIYTTVINPLSNDNKQTLDGFKQITTYHYRKSTYTPTSVNAPDGVTPVTFRPYIMNGAKNNSSNLVKEIYRNVMQAGYNYIQTISISTTNSTTLENIKKNTCYSKNNVKSKELRQIYDNIVSILNNLNLLLNTAKTAINYHNDKITQEEYKASFDKINDGSFNSFELSFQNNINTNDIYINRGINVQNNGGFGAQCTSNNDDNNINAFMVYINSDQLQLATEVVQGSGGINDLADYGIYRDYLKVSLEIEIEELEKLLREAQALMDLYDKQQADYKQKYEDYGAAYDDAQKTYSAYFGTEAFNYYQKINGNTILTAAEKKEIMQSYKNAVREAWWNFLSLLDAKYSLEKERGMYR